jgi:hypothetical protein
VVIAEGEDARLCRQGRRWAATADGRRGRVGGSSDGQGDDGSEELHGGKGESWRGDGSLPVSEN